MTSTPRTNRNTVLFGVTSSQSLKLLGDIPSAMVKLGWDVHVVSGDISSNIPEVLSLTKLHHLPMVRNPSPVNDIISLVRWVFLLRTTKPRIVVIGTPKASLVGLFASFICKVPIRVYHLRGLRLQTASGLSRYLLTFFEFLTSKLATSVLAVSPSLKREYCLLGLSPPNKVIVLGLGSSHGVDIVRFNPLSRSSSGPLDAHIQRAVEEGVPILGFVGRFSKDKGARELLHLKRVLFESQTRHILLVIGPLEDGEDILRQLKLM